MAKKHQFQVVYQQLNKRQRLAVDTIEGPVMVVAGPGTGKTQVLAARIANILLQTDTDPQSILALTFTDAAAVNMRERLFSLIGSVAYQVRIATFHKFANEVINSHPEYFPFSVDAEAISDWEMAVFLREFLRNPDLQYLRTPASPFHNLPAARSALNNLKQEGISLEQLRTLIEQEEKEWRQAEEKKTKTKILAQKKRLGKMKELAQLYQAYQQYLQDNHRYDFADMILWVRDAFQREPILLAEYQEKLQYFLVDEYQDTNSAQNQILDSLASFWGDQANVFVVGDPNQTIYRFQGASLENVLNFLERYPRTKLINLTQGYRCSQKIYDAAAAIIKKKSLADDSAHELFTLLSRPLRALQTGEKIPFLAAATVAEEEIAIVEKIKKLHQQGVSWSQMAVLFKKNRQIDEFVPLLKKWQIPFQFERRDDILRSRFIGQLLDILIFIDSLAKGGNADDFSRLLLFFWFAVDKFLVLQLNSLARKRQTNLWQLLAATPTESILSALPAVATEADVEQIKAVQTGFVELLAEEENMTLLAWLPHLLQKLAIDRWLMTQNDKHIYLQQLNSFYDYLKNLLRRRPDLNLAGLLEILLAMREENIAISEQLLFGDRNGIILSTAHNAKGKEWEYVFLPQLFDKNWGNVRSPAQLPLPAGILRLQTANKEEKNDDERRLFYVALTRAKRQVYLSFAQENEEHKKQVMSVFAGELVEQDLCRQWSVGRRQTTDESELLAAYVLPALDLPQSDSFHQWLLEKVRQLKLSPTALDKYLKDPEDFLLNNIFRFPRAKTPSLSFGTVVHRSLEYFVRHYQQQERPLSIEQLWQFFEHHLQKEGLAEDDYLARLKWGRQVLAAYVGNFELENPVLELEYAFGNNTREAVLDDDIYLTGKIDRIDLLDKERKLIKVVDYKTGAVKPLSQVLGKSYLRQLSDRERELPEAIRTSWKRQLLFYKLLTQLDSRFQYRVEFGELDFVENWAKNGKSGRLIIPLPDEEVELLKDLIRQVVAEIRQLKFLDGLKQFD